MQADITGMASAKIRYPRWQYCEDNMFDVAIIGGGINGACIYDNLSRQGYKTLLIDQGDFACASSQASAMMIWGGLLYLKNLDVASVYGFSKARDSMISNLADRVTAREFQYITDASGGHNKHVVRAALYLYWLLGGMHRRRPGYHTAEKESELTGLNGGSLYFEEGLLKDSDSRFVLQWISPHQQQHQVAMNYVRMNGGEYSGNDRCWYLQLQDMLNGNQVETRSRFIINCAGVWTDTVNKMLGIHSPYKHVFSKGVFVSTARQDAHHTPLIFDMGMHGDVLTYIPWGPVALWGPTETAVTSIEEGYRANEADVSFLLERSEGRLRQVIGKQDIISMRAGIRPLAVRSTYNKNQYPLDLSRTFRYVFDKDRSCISVYGGKITGCTEVADKIGSLVKQVTEPSSTARQEQEMETIEYTKFPAIEEKIPAIKWCQQNEFCCTLEDYYRRRTNLAQWVPREGLGRNNEYLEWIKKAASTLYKGNDNLVDSEVSLYQDRVRQRFDSVIAHL